MLLSELLDVLPEKKVCGYRDVDIESLFYDSRLVVPGSAFFCIKGLNTDGHLYAKEAISKGAVALFCEKEPDFENTHAVKVFVPDTREAMALCSDAFFRHPSRKMKIVGVTGTNGKTTTTFLIENICRYAGIKTGLIGTVELHIGEEKEPVVRTTPESLDLQKTLRRMADHGVQVVAMEVSSHALALKRVNGVEFNFVVFTNLTQDHLDFHITIEDYFAAKKGLFLIDQFGSERVAIVNCDDEFGLKIIEETKLPVRTFGIEREADVRAKNVEVLPGGNRFLLEVGDLKSHIKTQLVGRFNVYNCLAAAACSVEMGIGMDSIENGLANLSGIPGRFEKIDCGQDFSVFVDYAHTPDGIMNLLEACREVTDGRVIIVVGCGGDRDRSKRPLMGRVAVGLSDLCIITSDNPRSEDPHEIIEMILDGVRSEFPSERYIVEVDRKDAIYKAISLARKGDVVAIAGKGHESGQIFADRIIPFDDRVVAREALKEVKGAKC